MIQPNHIGVAFAIALFSVAVPQAAQAAERHVTGSASGTFVTTNLDFDQANESTPAAEIDLQGSLTVLGKISDRLLAEIKADSRVSCPTGQLGFSLVSRSSYSAVFRIDSSGDLIYVGGPAVVRECLNPDNGASTVKGTATISGGTGRFAAATGTESFRCASQALALDPSFHVFGSEVCTKTMDVSF